MNSNIISLSDAFKEYFPIGTAVNNEQLKLRQEFIKNHFNSISPENELKFINIQPKEGVYIFDSSDEIIEFAVKNKLLVRGHTLIWHQQTPDWVFVDIHGKQASKELLLERMKDHISHVVGKYKNRINHWDVINEAIDDSDDIFYRDNKWYSIMGEDYIDKAFHFAHEADPNALLFYNDYNESIKTKRDKIYQFIKGMKERGVPIHGIGIQGHYGTYFPDIADIKKSIEKFSELGLKIQITELDISVFGWEDRRLDLKQPTAGMLEKQAKKYEEIFDLFREYKDVINGVTLWGIADDYTWLDDFPVEGRKDWPLLFDENLVPKPAFQAITAFTRC